MKINLTDYISCFAAFVPDFDATGNPGTKAKICYQKTKEFVEILRKNSIHFPELKDISIKLEDLNNLFSDALLQQTKGLLKLNEETSLSVAVSRNQYGHMLAKIVLQNPDDFLDLIAGFIKEIKKAEENSKSDTIDEKKKLDKVDVDLLANSTVKLGFQDMFFGGAVDINAKTSRSNLSLLANGDFSNLKNLPVKLHNEQELKTLIETLQNFITRVEAIENKFGFVVEEIDNSLRFTQ
ncbi:hypothetical protein [Legionella hackeliae]|uniref:Uncharacterized protein n=1 Tax=Legionella hackeliae TaxID=449 RepID=A0A0A8UQ89_LEGHA|nr:hypothetical protein [Legionella hackeliae]KTD12937.1 hypothetical protein Lhac_1808 [Legionella hackeliae]CEK09247.1 protein of unknown function [coiled-coil domain] [Legionella hackeliae]STX49154.1 Uncharacterised protein [Legionella hackeliae]